MSKRTPLMSMAPPGMKVGRGAVAPTLKPPKMPSIPKGPALPKATKLTGTTAKMPKLKLPKPTKKGFIPNPGGPPTGRM
jgi:hypothetical protein